MATAARLLGLGAAAVIVIAAAGWAITRPRALDPAATAGLSGDAVRGEWVFWASGCASCHAAPGSEDKLVLAGGQRFVTEFGTFVAPNISTDAQAGIGGWTLAQFATALTQGTSPEGRHYYPAFPYAAYRLMALQDVADLKAFMDTLPASDAPSAPHELAFPFSLRAGLGVWKALALGDEGWVMPAGTPELEHGRYIAEALAHCGECHTPRDGLGRLDTARWMAGAPNPSGQGRIPGLTPGQLDWSAEDIAYYLESGFTPGFDSAGGHMAEVVRNMARLTAEDRAAVAAYVKALPPAE
ncbi:c-type cytochrome [Palleronia sp. KMU-117]|uniref:c-type cytochrome n=1 Tax=Palleronia sp. KMU-117 TaxID=3434108 RepID=UPI003D712EB9